MCCIISFSYVFRHIYSNISRQLLIFRFINKSIFQSIHSLIYRISIHPSIQSFIQLFTYLIYYYHHHLYKVRSKDWHQYLSIRMKYLLISIFLAGANPKDTDPIKFIGHEFNRRKKSSRGKDDNHNNNNSSSSTNISLTNFKRKLDCNQYFSLERLLCIYIQVIRNNINSDVMHEYGDISLYSNVSDDHDVHDDNDNKKNSILMMVAVCIFILFILFDSSYNDT